MRSDSVFSSLFEEPLKTVAARGALETSARTSGRTWPSRVRDRVLRAGAVLGILSVGACDGGAATPDGGTWAERPELRCDREGYPCTWSEVATSVRDRTHRIGQVASLLLEGGSRLDEVESFIAEQDGIVEVGLVADQIRFRMDGGRPGRVLRSTVMDHHRTDPATLVDSSAAPGPPPQTGPPALSARGATHRFGMIARSGSRLKALVTSLGPAPLGAVEPQAREAHGVAADEPGEGKKALVISPYEYDWPGTGAGAAQRARVIRDYRESEGGSVIYHADLRDIDDNPENPGPLQRVGNAADGELLISSEVRFEDFLDWGRYNMVILASHGAPDRCPYHESGECPAIFAGRPKRESYAGYPGVEVLYYPIRRYGEERPPDPDTEYPRPRQDAEEWTRLPIEESVHPGLTEPEANYCMRRIDAGEEAPETAGGKPCTYPRWEHERPRLLLTYEFFLSQYGGGLDDVFVFLWACSSGLHDLLPGLLAQEGNENVTVLGWTAPVDGGVGQTVLHRSIELIEDGWHSEELMRRLDEIDTTDLLTGRAMRPDEGSPSPDAEVVERSANTTHGRDVVLLVDPTTEAELEDSASVLVRGVPGDGLEDTLRVFPQIMGVADTDPLEEIRLYVRTDAESERGEGYRPGRNVGKGVWRYEDGVEMGRDHFEGERVDLEVRADLPGGGESRWVYEDLRLVSRYWTLQISGGPASGHYEGHDARAVVQDGRLVSVGLHDVGHPQCPVIMIRPRTSVTTTGEADAEAEVGFLRCDAGFGDMAAGTAYQIANAGRGQVVDPSAEPGLHERPPMIELPSPAVLDLRELSGGWAEGSLEGQFYESVNGGERLRYDRRVGVTIEFRAQAGSSGGALPP